MKVVVIVEGATEADFKAALLKFLEQKLERSQLPRLKIVSQDGRVPKENALKRLVENFCRENDAVIALTDVYTGTDDFVDGADAKKKMARWVGKNSQFYPHVAQHDFEAWLLPYWDTIKQLSGTNRNPPSGPPEQVNHNNPPSRHINEAFRTGTKKRRYSKTRDGARILRDNDLMVAADACPELKAFLNTIITLCGGEPLP